MFLFVLIFLPMPALLFLQSLFLHKNSVLVSCFQKFLFQITLVLPIKTTELCTVTFMGLKYLPSPWKWIQ